MGSTESQAIPQIPTSQTKQQQLERILELFRESGCNITESEGIWYLDKPEWGTQGSVDIDWVERAEYTGWHINAWLYGEEEDQYPVIREMLETLDFPVKFCD